LTASDGTGLRLVALAAQGVVEPPIAFTELRLAFENPRDEVVEGRFRIALPPGAALSRFAMAIDGRWQEGEVVERQRARQAYEDFLHRRQDPALLEQEAGNEFSARVFPIPARGRKELIVSWSHALARAGEPYRIPLLGLPEVGELDVRVLLGERPAGAAASSLGGVARDRRVVEIHKRAWTPDRDFEVGQDEAGGPRSGLRHGHLAVVRVAPRVDAAPQGIAGLYVLVDSSASRALGWEAQVDRLAELVGGLRDGAGGATPLGVAAFDQEVAPVFEGAASGFGARAAARLRDRRALGASDLEGALRWLGERLAASRGRYPRVLLLTDGVATAGATEVQALRAAVAALGPLGVERLDVVAFGGLRDEAALRALATGNLAHDGRALDGAAPAAEIARRLTAACRSGIAVAVEGAAWVWPETLDGVQPGDEALVYADLPAGRPLHVTLDGRPAPLAAPQEVERPLLERAWAQARIERLLHLRETAHAGDADLHRALTREVAELSVRHRVLSPYTAFLVLETEDDYRRFGLDRAALADILTVGAAGLEVAARSRPALARPSATWAAVPKPPPPAARRIGEGRRDAGVGVGEPAATAGEEIAGEPSGDAFVQAPAEIPDLGREGLGEGEPAGVPGGTLTAVAGVVAGGTPAEDSGVDEPEPAQPPALRVGASPGGSDVEEVVISRDRRARRWDPRAGRGEAERAAPDPWEGRFGRVMEHLAAGEVAPARLLAEAWCAEAPGDLLALVALGEAWEAAGDAAGAARAYGSLIDLFPGRADLRRYAGERLERLGEAGLALAADTYAKAALDRPDHPSGHRLLAWALLRAGRHEEAFAALETGLDQRYPEGRFAGVDAILRQDLGLLAAAWLRAEPQRRDEVLARLAARQVDLEREPSLRFVLTWETDANDVDLHVRDRRGGHAYYDEPALPSGGELVADVTTGYGPECFAVPAPAGRRAGPYRLSAHYYRRGPMGYGLGLLQVVEHDGRGGLTVEPRPFVVMVDDAWVDLGSAGA
jgi:hypothetical protein